MTKTTRRSAAATEEAFHKHHAATWGQERWHQSLYPALAETTRYAALVNRYAAIEDFWRAMDEADIPRNELAVLNFPELTHGPQNEPDQHGPGGSSAGAGILCLTRNPAQKAGADDVTILSSGHKFPPPKHNATHAGKLMTHWNLDAASALAVHLLCVKPGDAVLDLCAAPGGKSVTLSQTMYPTHCGAIGGAIAERDAGEQAGNGPSGRLVSNEADGRRQKRLVENLSDYIPSYLLNAGYVRCTNIDGTSASATALTAGKGGYDKVLVDAPCSSERHIIHAHLKARATGGSAPEMSNWRPGSSKRQAEIQTRLLMTALKAAKLGGDIMYATCSIGTAENDGVLGKTMREVAKERKKGTVGWNIRLGFGEEEDGQAIEAELEAWAERTNYGWIVLPDHARNGKWGPLFFAKIRKVAP